ncbi:MAG: hypothetical protein J3K34DRAFT_210998 [Monoraphidium minutum]|nr:MAG: hypothetical protein J3K34DRAFT_210998 [Monoraphidium minutum]
MEPASRRPGTWTLALALAALMCAVTRAAAVGELEEPSVRHAFALDMYMQRMEYQRQLEKLTEEASGAVQCARARVCCCAQSAGAGCDRSCAFGRRWLAHQAATDRNGCSTQWAPRMLAGARSRPAGPAGPPPSALWAGDSMQGAERDGAAEGPARVMRSLPNAREALQGHLRRVLGVGVCATDTVYYKLWRGAMARDLHGDSCLVNVNPSLVTFAEGRTMMRLRTDTQWTAKQAVRCGRARSDTCGLCGQPVGGTHAAMACPATKQQRIARHNAAGRLVLRALAEGRLGAGLCMADVGRVDSEDVAEDAVGPRLALKRLLPEYLAPPAARRLRPDIALLQPGPGGTVVHVVELKYCMDSGMGEVLTAAAAQHAALLAHIDGSLPGHSARLHVVPLGATGGVPRSLGATLERLGVRKSALKRVRRDLHLSAVRRTHRVIMTRAALISGRGAAAAGAPAAPVLRGARHARTTPRALQEVVSEGCDVVCGLPCLPGGGVGGRPSWVFSWHPSFLNFTQGSLSLSLSPFPFLLFSSLSPFLLLSSSFSILCFPV